MTEKLKAQKITKVEGSIEEKVIGYGNVIAYNAMVSWHNEDPEAFFKVGENRGCDRESWIAHVQVWDNPKAKELLKKMLTAITEKNVAFLKEYLHTGNANYRQIFTLETSIELGKTNKSMEQALNGWT